MVSDAVKLQRAARPLPNAKIMNLYSLLVFLHVLTAILGLGPLTVLAIASSAPAPAMPLAPFARLLRLVGWSLGAMLATGILIIAQTHGALGKTGWVRVSVGLFLVLGALQGLVRRRLKRSPDPTPSATLPRGLSPLLWTMCAIVGAITYLMEAKPW
jgi:hypothetical protein